MDSLKSKIADNKARIIFENERRLFDEIIRQLADLDPVEEIQDNGNNYKHYKLPTGQHIYVTGQHYVLTNQEISISNKSSERIYREIFSDEFENGHALISPNISLFEGRGLSDVIEYRLGNHERSGYPLGRFSVSRGVKFDDGKPITGYSRNWGFSWTHVYDNRSTYMDTEQDTIIGMIESVLERIGSNSYFDGKGEHIAGLVREFAGLVEPFEIEEIEHESEESIEQKELIIKAEKTKGEINPEISPNDASEPELAAKIDEATRQIHEDMTIDNDGSIIGD